MAEIPPYFVATFENFMASVPPLQAFRYWLGEELTLTLKSLADTARAPKTDYPMKKVAWSL